MYLNVSMYPVSLMLAPIVMWRSTSIKYYYYLKKSMFSSNKGLVFSHFGYDVTTICTHIHAHNCYDIMQSYKNSHLCFTGGYIFTYQPTTRLQETEITSQWLLLLSFIAVCANVSCLYGSNISSLLGIFPYAMHT